MYHFLLFSPSVKISLHIKKSISPPHKALMNKSDVLRISKN